MANSSTWTWGPGGPEINYASEWVVGRPYMEFSEQACVYFMMVFGGWYDHPCEMYDSGVICEK